MAKTKNKLTKKEIQEAARILKKPDASKRVVASYLGVRLKVLTHFLLQEGYGYLVNGTSQSQADDDLAIGTQRYALSTGKGFYLLEDRLEELLRRERNYGDRW